MQLYHRRYDQHRWRASSGGTEYIRGALKTFAGRLAACSGGDSSFHAQGKRRQVDLRSRRRHGSERFMQSEHPIRRGCFERISNETERLGRNAMGLAIATKSFECAIDGGLAHIVLNQPDRGNPIDGDFCREFSLCMAELSERDDVRSVLMSARGRLFSVGGDLASLASRGVALPATIKSWTADLHTAIVRMVRMRAPVVAAVHCNVAGGSGSLIAAAGLGVFCKKARISSAFAKFGFCPHTHSS